jgi:hypothetical protein
MPQNEAFLVGESLLDEPTLLRHLHKDERLSQHAHGLLAVALGYPRGTTLSATILHYRHTFDDKAAIESTLKELRDCGYLRTASIGGGEAFTVLYASTALAAAVAHAQPVVFPAEVAELVEA